MQQDTDIIAIVAANVREARKAAGLSQEELALEAALDRTYISQVERGKRNVTVVVLARLARATRTTVAALVSECSEAARNARDSVQRSVQILAGYGGAAAALLIAASSERRWGDWLELILSA